MIQISARPARRASALGGAAFAVALVVGACGGASSPSTSAAPSVAPSPAAPSVAPSVTAPSVNPSVAAPSASGGTGSAVDPAEDLKIGAPYTLVALPPQAKAILEAQMAQNLGASANEVSFGFRQVSGGSAPANVVLVLRFQSGTLNDITYGAVLGAMTAAMKADLTKSTVEGVEISSGKITSGAVAIYHVGDDMVMAISSGAEEALPVATAMIKAK